MDPHLAVRLPRGAHPEVGDYYVYDIGPYCFIVTRVTRTEIRAYFNACLHRGTKLRASGTEGSASDFTCSFHGWSWNIDGSNKRIVCPWDFPHADPKEFSLPEARVETLGGFVWINMDPDAPDLARIPRPRGAAPHRGMAAGRPLYRLPRDEAHSGNWKLNSEAFLEGYHVLATHPQVAAASADANAQYDIYGENVSRYIAPLGVLSPHFEGR